MKSKLPHQEVETKGHFGGLLGLNCFKHCIITIFFGNTLLSVVLKVTVMPEWPVFEHLPLAQDVISGVLSSVLGTPQGTCFSLCLYLCLSLSVSLTNKWIKSLNRMNKAELRKEKKQGFYRSHRALNLRSLHWCRP